MKTRYVEFVIEKPILLKFLMMNALDVWSMLNVLVASIFLSKKDTGEAQILPKTFTLVYRNQIA